MGLARLGIDPAPLFGAAAAARPAACEGGARLSLAVAGRSLGEVLAVAGDEAISRPFRFVVAVATASPPDPAGLVGSAARLGVSVPGASVSVLGLVTEARVGATPQGYGMVVATLEPNLAPLSRGSGYSVHQGLSAPDLVSKILDSAGITPQVVLKGHYPPLEFQVRYGESLLGFVGRLLEREGIHYHFAADGTIVLADTNDAFPAADTPLTYAGDGASGGLALTRFARGTGDVPTLATVRGFDFLRPSLLIEGVAGTPGGAEAFVFSSAVTSVDVARQQAQGLLEAAAVGGQLHVGASGVPALRAGRRLTVTDTAGGGLGGSYVVTSVRHVALREGQGKCFSYGNEFSAIPASTQFRPARSTPVPSVGGALPAVVAGPPGSAVYRDQYGRIKVQFRFDREGQSDENSSAWISVSVPSGRTNELFVPEVGDEVLVAFVEGDPSQPVVLGSLYNSTHPPPVP
jgi:type VI secretion system secreted protein VgrG